MKQADTAEMGQRTTSLLPELELGVGIATDSGDLGNVMGNGVGLIFAEMMAHGRTTVPFQER